MSESIRALLRQIEDRVKADQEEKDLEIERLRDAAKLCPICGHPWKIHDPADGRCDSGIPCDCGRDINFHRKRNAEISQEVLDE